MAKDGEVSQGLFASTCKMLPNHVNLKWITYIIQYSTSEQ